MVFRIQSEYLLHSTVLLNLNKYDNKLCFRVVRNPTDEGIIFNMFLENKVPQSNDCLSFLTYTLSITGNKGQ